MTTLIIQDEMKRPKPVPVNLSYGDVESIRKELGITVVEFCRVLGISISTYYSWSQPGRVPMGSTAILLGLIAENPFGEYSRIRKFIEEEVENA